MSQPRRILIVGGVAGGASAATRARRLNEHADIVIFEKDDYVSFANCGLPYHIGGEIKDRSKLLVATPQSLFARYRLDVRVRTEVLSIDRQNKTISVVNHNTKVESTERYDQLILAPGASPIVPDAHGIGSNNVLSLRNVADTDRIKKQVDAMSSQGAQGPPPQQAVVVGGGFIGLEMAEQLADRGLAVTLVERNPQVLPLMDFEMAAMLHEELQAHDVKLVFGDGLVGFETTPTDTSQSDSTETATAAVLASGQTLKADLFILGIGVRPNVALAQQAHLDLGATGGITVNEHLQTNDPNIYAVGDAVEYVYRPTETAMRIALAGPANRAGRIAGEHAASDAANIPMTAVLGTSVVRVFGLTAGLTGLSANTAKRFGVNVASVTIVANHHVGYYPGAKPITLKLTYDPDTQRVLGAQAIGAAGVDKRLDVIATLIQLGGTLEQLAGLDLCYAPPFGSAKDPIHMAAFTALNAVHGLAKFLDADADLSGMQILDVRTAAEIARGMLAGAIHIPVDDLRDQLDKLAPEKPTVVVCASGLRGYVASRVLMQNGFTDVADLSGGMMMRRRAKPNETLV
ncbi:MAG: FAD-dependent oxidoreductase [Algisphaera sp.]